MSTLPLDQARPPSPAAQRTVAWAVVIAVHALIGAWLMTTTRTTPPRADDHRISLRWLAPTALPVPAPALPQPAVARPAASARSTVTSRQPPVAEYVTDAIVDVASAPLDLGLRGDAVSGGDGIDAATLAPKLIGRRQVHAAFQDRPRYFRMRPQMSPQQILAGVAQFLGLWPPGYTDDPCTLGRQDLQYFQDAVDERDRQALRDAIHQVSANCR